MKSLNKFKSGLLCFGLVFAITSAANAQEGFKDYFNIGIEGGVQYANVSDAYVTETKSGTGPEVGVFLEYKKFKSVKIRSGVYYDSRSFSSVSSIYPIRVGDSIGYHSYFVSDIDYRNQYLTIPLSLLYMKGEQKFKVFIQASVYYSFLLTATRRGDGLLYIDPQDAPKFTDPDLTPGNHFYNYEGQVTENFNSYDFGIGISLGFAYQVSPRFMLQMAPGFMESFADVYADPLRPADWSGQFRINAGLVYSFKGN